MNKLIKPASLLFYLLVLLVFFLLGMTFAGLSGAAKGQGLAGGAIVFGYGVLFGGIAFVAALFVAFHAKHRVILIANRILAIILALAIGIFTYRFMSREGKQKPIEKQPVETTVPAPIGLFQKQ